MLSPFDNKRHSCRNK